MRTYLHPLRTFGDLLAFDLEATLSCRCTRHGTIDATSDFFRDRPIGGACFRCTTILPHGKQCNERRVPHVRHRDREQWNLCDHWRAMMRRNLGADRPDRTKTYRDYVHAGQIAWLIDTGCGGGYSIPMIAFDEPPWDRLLDEPIGAIVCPTCRKAMKIESHKRREWSRRTRHGEFGWRRSLEPPAPDPGRSSHHHRAGLMVGLWPHPPGTLSALRGLDRRAYDCTTEVPEAH
jgi:hypothetical protein